MNIQQVKQRGFTLLELLVTLFIGNVFLLASFSVFNKASTVYHDIKIREAVNDTAKSVLAIVGNDLRMIGNGLPFDQVNFKIQETLTDGTTDFDQDASSGSATRITHPLHVDESDDDEIVYKLNESGIVHFVTTGFVPGTTTINLTSTAGLYAGDSIYFSTKVTGGENGLMASIASVDSGTQITLESTQYYSPELTNVSAGTTVEPVVTVELFNDNNQIIRNAGFGDVVLADNASFTLTYWSNDGVTEIVPPLTVQEVAQDLGSIEITVTVESELKHRILTTPKQTFTFTRSQTYGLRSFNFTY